MASQKAGKMTLRGGGVNGGGGRTIKVDSLKGAGEQGPTYSPGGAGRKGMHGDSGWERL